MSQQSLIQRRGIDTSPTGVVGPFILHCVVSGEWTVDSGGWRVEGGEWRVESGGWRVSSAAMWGHVCPPHPLVSRR
jgi:hypothetical protein